MRLLKHEVEETKLRAIFASSPDAIVVTDLNGNIIDCNQATLDIHGFSSKEEIIGKSGFEFIAKKDHQRAMEDLKKILEQGSVKSIQYTCLTKDGHEFPAEFSASVIKDYSGNPTGFVAIAKDITERKQMEEALRESEEKYRTQFEEALDAIFLADVETGITIDCNRAATELVGREKSELVGKHQRILHPPEEIEGEFSRTFKQHLKEKEGQVLETQVITKKGEIKEVAIKGSVFELRGKKLIQGIFRDITERKKMEEELRESEEKFRSLFEGIYEPVSIYVGREGRLIGYNQAYKKIVGYTDEELKDKTFLDFAHPDDRAMVLEKYRTKYPEEELPLVYEIRLVNKKGETIPVEISAGPYKKKGRIIGIEVIHRDLTERKRMEEELRESEERLRNLYECIPDSLGVYVGREGRLLEYNKAFKKRVGYTDEELKDKTFLDFVHPDDHALVLERYRTKKYSEEDFPIIYEIRSVNKKGESRPFEISVAPYKKKGRIIGIEVMHRDLTERKKMEEKLRQYSEHLEELVQKGTEELLESEKRYSVLVEKARDGVFIGQDGKIVFVNKRGAEILGCSRHELMKLPFEKVLDEKYRQLVTTIHRRRLLGEKVPATYEVEMVAKTGERIPVEVSATRINYQGRPAALAITRDISERKQMEEERLKLGKLATIGEVATMVGHDLRNPLQSIENATYYLNNELPRILPSIIISQKTVEMLEIIKDSVNYADKIIRNLHDFSATKKPVLRKTNINTIVKETLSQVKAPKNVKLITELGHLPQIEADKDMIKQAFLNLATNGIQAMENGGTLKASTKKTKGFIEVKFEDTGTGIPKENMKKIFTPFFTTRAQGMGMGLPICKKFVEAHSGNIEVESEEGKGSTFTVKLPIQQKNGCENH